VRLLAKVTLFRARKDSAYGTLSIYDALRVFSIRSLVAAKQDKKNEELVNAIISNRSSSFLRIDYLF
jgi:glyceraldehyde-3-phosphate dehydrogenase (NADP+)